VNCYELTSKFTLAETGRNLFLPYRFKLRFKPPLAETCQPCLLFKLNVILL